MVRQGRVAIVTGPLSFRVRSNFPDVASWLHDAYRHHPVRVDADFADFSVEVRSPLNLRRWLRPQAEFVVDGEAPFEPLPRDQAPALLEWGLNWTIAASCHQWLMIHAASIERGGRAAILPAPPGSGKSTLCASLALRDWRLLTDEMTLLDPATGNLLALARPVNLKNASIDIIRNFEPGARWGPMSFDTIKGRITHLCPPEASVRQMDTPATPAWIVFPRYVAGAEPKLTPRSKRGTFMHFAENAFNYSILGRAGFEMVGRLVQQCECYDLEYSRLEDGLEVFDWLSDPQRDD